jgi:hypothetical protein
LLRDPFSWKCAHGERFTGDRSRPAPRPGNFFDDQVELIPGARRHDMRKLGMSEQRFKKLLHPRDDLFMSSSW